MAFRRNLRPVNSIKNIAEASGILAATTDTILLNAVITVDDPALSTANEVEKGCSINWMFLSCFFYAEGGEVANEVPLVDWYVYKNNANQASLAELPTPGATGTDNLKRFILHTEKGLAGGGDASLTGVPMVFKGVIKFPRSFKRMGVDDRVSIVARSNFATKFCVQAIYKWYK